MGKEIEKKYLLSGLPAGLDNGVEILQGYLSAGDPEVRIRSKGEQFFVTRKGGEEFVRSEEEFEVSQKAFQIFWPITVSARVEKVRYRLIGEDGLIWEVDKYGGHLSGLFTAEVELPSEEVNPIMPKAIADVLVADVTADKSYKNKALAVFGLPARK